jgi:hypothetical protein
MEKPGAGKVNVAPDSYLPIIANGMNDCSDPVGRRTNGYGKPVFRNYRFKPALAKYPFISLLLLIRINRWFNK